MLATTEHPLLPAAAELRLQELAIQLPAPPEPFGTYTEAVGVGSLLFLSGTLPTEGRIAKFVGRLGAEFDTAVGREASRLAAVNAVAIARQDVFGPDKNPTRLMYGVASLPLGTPVEVELTFEVQG